MNLSTILKELNISHEIIGSDYFESLGFIEDEAKEKLCSFAVNSSYRQEMSESISLVITVDKGRSDFDGCNLCIVEDPRKTFFALHQYLLDFEKYRRFRFKTLVNRKAKISPGAYIAENNVIIGENVVVEECAVIKENTAIGDNTVIRSGSIIGGSGIMHNHGGGVIIGKGVIIQHNCCIEKALFPWNNTEIDDWVRIDNSVHISQGERIESGMMVMSNMGGTVKLKPELLDREHQ